MLDTVNHSHDCLANYREGDDGNGALYRSDRCLFVLDDLSSRVDLVHWQAGITLSATLRQLVAGTS